MVQNPFNSKSKPVLVQSEELFSRACVNSHSAYKHFIFIVLRRAAKIYSKQRVVTPPPFGENV